MKKSIKKQQQNRRNKRTGDGSTGKEGEEVHCRELNGAMAGFVVCGGGGVRLLPSLPNRGR